MSGFLTGFLLPCVYAVMACLAFCFLLNQRGRLMVVSSLGGGVGWAVCLLCAFTGSDILQYFAGSVAVAIYAEVMARVMKSPATGFLVVGVGVGVVVVVVMVVAVVVVVVVVVV